MPAALALLAFLAGAILRFAVNVSSTSFNYHEAGVVLMVVGGVAFILALIASSGYHTWRKVKRVAKDGSTYEEEKGF